MTSFEMLAKLKELKENLIMVYMVEGGRVFSTKEAATQAGYRDILQTVLETPEYVALSKEVEASKIIVKQVKPVLTLTKDVDYNEAEEEDNYEEEEDEYEGYDEGYDENYDDEEEYDVPVIKTGPTNETAQSLQDKLKNLSALKGGLKVEVKPVLTNDDRDNCYDCGAPIKEVDSGFKVYRVCSNINCGK